MCTDLCWNCCLLYPFKLVLRPRQGGYMEILLDLVNVAKDIILATGMSEPCSRWITGTRHPLWYEAMCLAYPHLLGYPVGGFCPSLAGFSLPNFAHQNVVCYVISLSVLHNVNYCNVY